MILAKCLLGMYCMIMILPIVAGIIMLRGRIGLVRRGRRIY